MIRYQIFTEAIQEVDDMLTSDRQVWFEDLVTIPKRECKPNQRKKTFQAHLLSSNENQMIIHKAEEASKKKEEQLLKRQNAMKKVIQEERKIEQQKKKKWLAEKTQWKSKNYQLKGWGGGPKL